MAEFRLKGVADQLAAMAKTQPSSSTQARKVINDLEKISPKIREALEEASEAALSPSEHEQIQSMMTTLQDLEDRYLHKSKTGAVLAKMNRLLDESR